MTTTLPNKLSELLLLAVKDAKACEAMPERFKLNMSAWHAPNADGTCSVCMAGAVMAQTLHVSDIEIWEPADFDGNGDIARKLRAINRCREGEFDTALLGLGRVVERGQTESLERAWELVEQAFVPGDECAPWHVYEQAAAILAEAGL